MKKEIVIIQPGRIGDILIVLPIAQELCKTHKVIWPVWSEYQRMVEQIHIENLMFVDVGSMDMIPAPLAKKRALSYVHKGRTALDLAIGFGDPQLDALWKETGLPFDVWKYRTAGVDYAKKYTLRVPVCPQRDVLMPYFDMYKCDLSKPYCLTHSSGSHDRYFHFKKEDFPSLPPQFIEIQQVGNSTIFDWVPILLGAQAVLCVDSCIANLVDQMGIRPTMGRYFHLWREYYTQDQLKMLTPQMSSDWIIV